MRSIKLLTSASSVCLILAAGNVLADAPAHHTQKQQAVKVAKKIKLAAPAKKSLSKAPAKPVVAPSAKIAAPKPVNLSHKYFGFGPDSRIKINGFMSAGFSATDAQNNAQYNIPGHGAISDNLRFAPNSLAGIQFTGNITPDLSAVIQLVATGDNTDGNKAYRPQVDWAFIRYKLNDKLAFRVGRMRLPTYLYSQTEEVGYTYAPVFLPPEIYRLVPFYDFNGVDLTYVQTLGDTGWSIKVNPYFGENTSEFDLYTNTPKFITPGVTAKFDENYLYGGDVEVGNQYVTLRGSYAHTNLSMSIPSFISPMGQPMPAMNNIIHNAPASFYSVGGKLDYKNFVVISEFGQRSTPAKIASLSGYYTMAGYRIAKFLPYVMYARMWTTNNSDISQPASELAEAQHTITVGTDYYINSNLVAKAGVSQITPDHGTNGLFTNNPGRKHVIMYSASLDIIF